MRPFVFAAITLATPCIAHAQVVGVEPTPIATDATTPSIASAAPQTPHARSFGRSRGVPYRGGPIPPNAHVEWRHPRNAALAGAAVLGLSYAGTVALRSLLCATSPCSPGSTWLYAPGFGPLVYAFDSPTSLHALLGALDFLVQGTGAMLIVLGTTLRRGVLVNDARRDAPSHEAAMSWAVIPAAAPGFAGASLIIAAP